MNKASFAQLYKTWPADQLLDIINNPDEYQPVALEAARAELDSRQLSEADLESAFALHAGRQKEKADRQRKAASIDHHIQSAGSTIAEALRPVENVLKVDKQIRYVSIAFGVIALINLYRELPSLRYMFSDSSAVWDMGMVWYLLLPFLFPAAVVMFWFRKKLGWIFSALFFAYALAGALIFLFSVLTSRLEFGAGLYAGPSPTTLLGSVLIYGGATWVLTKASIRKAYGIDKPVMWLSMAAGVVIVLLMSLQ